ncbi:MAG: aminoglycoside phosphotransferase family protein [Clostridiaceae bacterium]|nr:aminoglycoside phosphotransferase family protein [Eubacteriales bacterium]
MRSRTKCNAAEADVKRLFAANGIAIPGEITPLGAGEYNAVFSAADADGTEYAVKIAPEPRVAVMAMEKSMMASELFWYDLIRERTSIRVPKVYAADFTKKVFPADYFIMEKLKGEQLDKAAFTEAEKAESASILARMAAGIHRIENDRFGYVQNGLYPNWYEAIRAMVSNVLGDCARAHHATPRGRKLLRLIDRHRAVLESVECCMVNFDLWPPNVLCTREADGIRYAWLDPERSFWGDRICDFVCLEPMTPLKEKTASLTAYNAAAEKPVLATGEECVRYAVGVGYLALIMEVEKYFRYSPFHYGWWRNAGASAMFFKQAFETLEQA